MRFGSLFAGIRGFDLALVRVGMESAYAAEMDDKCNQVARNHFPDERQVTNVAAVSGREFHCDVLTAGWPCQGNSVAGRRAGMADQRSGLWGEVKRIIAEQHPKWFFGENVPGILSVNDGRDWETVLRDLAELGYGFAYRILDAQWFGVPQRRRRVFVVGCARGDWRRAAQVLFESESLPWNSPPCREAGEGIAANVAMCLNAKGGSGRIDGESETFVTHPLFTKDNELAVAFAENQRGELRQSDVSPQLSCGGGKPGSGYSAVAFQCSQSGVRQVNAHATLDSNNGSRRHNGIVCGMAVRRLTPRECERLQGFPDDWTRYGADGKEIADGPRYRMLGNAVAVPVVEWIGRRIVENND